MSSDSDHDGLVHRNTHKRKKIVSSDSESSDESVIVQTRRKKKIYRVVSEGESSSDDSVPKPVIRRQKNYRVISEDESNYDSSTSETSTSCQSDCSFFLSANSDWTSSDELNKDCKKYNAKQKVLSKRKGNANEDDKPGPSSSSNADVHSDSSGEQSEKCPICLLPFRKQQVGMPSSCEHSFCLECLLEWSKNINTCPVDRQSFIHIAVKNNLRGKVIKTIPVKIVPRIENQLQDDPTFCEVCHQSDREDRMLLCDNCDRGYHLECLTPPLTTVPIEEWFCPECMNNSTNRMYLRNFLPSLVMSQRPGRRILQFRNSIFRRIFPRHISNMDNRTYVPADTLNRARPNARDNVTTEIIEHEYVNPNLPSTSSGLDSIGDNSRSRSPNTSLEGNAPSSTRSNKKTKTKTTKKKKRKHVKSSKRDSNNMVREVRITELNNDGEEEEIVTYVKVASSSKRKCKKRTKKTRKV